MTNSKAKLESVCLVPTALIHIKNDKKVKNKGLESCDGKCEEAGRPMVIYRRFTGELG